MTIRTLRVFVLITMLFMTTPSYGDLTVHIGPASVGGGGPNPISIPPINPLDYEFVWLTENHTEWSLSLFPGLLYGYRAVMQSGGYISAGAGMVLNIHGVGPGFYTAFGFDHCAWLCFNVEYKQAIGFIPGMLINPYALRIGLVFFRN